MPTGQQRTNLNYGIERGTRHQLQAAAISRNNTTTNRNQYQRWGGYSGQDSAVAEDLGRTITRCFGRQFEQRKMKQKNTLHGCKQPTNDEEPHNNKPKDSVGDVGRCYDKMRPQRNVWGDDFRSFGAA
jgi:hypothetical protein